MHCFLFLVVFKIQSKVIITSTTNAIRESVQAGLRLSTKTLKHFFLGSSFTLHSIFEGKETAKKKNHLIENYTQNVSSQCYFSWEEIFYV